MSFLTFNYINMRTRTPWTVEEDNNLREIVKNAESWDEIMEQFQTHRTRSAVANRANALGLRLHDEWSSPSRVKDILEKELSRNPTNIQEVFKIVSAQTHLKPDTIRKYYYSDSSYLSRKNLKTCFMLLGKRTAYKNTKTVATDTRVSLWQRIKNTLTREIWRRI